MSGHEVQFAVNKEQLRERIGILFHDWDTSETLKEADLIFVPAGKQAANMGEGPAFKLQLWLYGFLFPDSCVVLCRRRRGFAFFGSAKKLTYLSQIKTALPDGEASILQLSRPADAEEAVKLVDEFFNWAKGEGNKEGDKEDSDQGPLRVGYAREAARDAPLDGNCAPLIKDAFLAALTAGDKAIALKEADVSWFLERSMSVLSQRAMEMLVSTTKASEQFYKSAVVAAVTDALQTETAITHVQLAAEVERIVSSMELQDKWRTKYDIDAEQLEILHFNVLSQGCPLDLGHHGKLSDNRFSIANGSINMIGAVRYIQHGVAFARTYLITPTGTEKRTYNACLEALRAIELKVKAGVKLRELAASCREAWEEASKEIGELEEGESLELNRDFGFLIPQEFGGQPACRVVETMADYVDIPAGGVIYCRLAVEIKGGTRPAAVVLGNSLLVPRNDAAAKVITAGLPIERRKNVFNLSSQQTEEVKREPRGVEREAEVQEANTIKDRLRSRRGPASAQARSNQDQARLGDRQQKLRTQLLRECRDKYAGERGEEETNSVKRMEGINLFREPADFAPGVRPNHCFVDVKNECVFIPVFGAMIPFSIHNIRQCKFQERGDRDKKLYYHRFTFMTPASVAPEGWQLPAISGPREVFIKELCVKSDRPSDIHKQITELQKKIKQKDTMGPMATIEQLKLNGRSATRVFLRNLLAKYIGVPTRKSVGILEAHLNGLRFQVHGRSEAIDINFNNIKTCIFKPTNTDLVAILHFRLKNPIMVANKRQLEIQFSTEIGALVEDLESNRRRHRDPDELFEEHKELQIRLRTNQEYMKFIQGMQEFASDVGLVVEQPFPKLSFRGAPGQEVVTLTPTKSTLCSVAQWPCFLLQMEEVELFSLERVIHGLRNFDISVIFRDMNAKPMTINAVPMEDIDMIKQWLTESDVVWYESKVSLNWARLVKTRKADPEGFYSLGFSFMADANPEDEDGDRSDASVQSSDDEGDELFDDGHESYSEDGRDDQDSSVAGGSEESEGESDGSESQSGYQEAAEEDEEDGLDWDEMERREMKSEQDNRRKRPMEEEPTPAKKRVKK